MNTDLTTRDLTIHTCSSGWQLGIFLFTWPDFSPELENIIMYDWDGLEFGLDIQFSKGKFFTEPSYSNPKGKEFYDQSVRKVREENVELDEYVKEILPNINKELEKDLVYAMHLDSLKAILFAELATKIEEMECKRVIESTISEVIK